MKNSIFITCFMMHIARIGIFQSRIQCCSVRTDQYFHLFLNSQMRDTRTQILTLGLLTLQFDLQTQLIH